MVLECLLILKEQLVHVPEAILRGSGLGRRCRCQGVWMDAGQREMPEREPHTAIELCFYAHDRPVRLARVRAFVVAVLENPRTRGPSSDVVDAVVHRRQDRLAARWNGLASHQ